MNKSYKTYALIGLSTISLSLTGSEPDQQRSQLQQSDSNTWILQPLGGYIQLHQNTKEELCTFYKDHSVEKSIYFIPLSNDTKHTIYQFLQYGMRPTVPLNLFTEAGKAYTMTHNNNTFTIVSDRLYEEKEFLTYKGHWQKIHTNKNQ
jgi:hydroxymethylpyrimidine pyrophosphatase-like HAD family hydrolase